MNKLDEFGWDKAFRGLDKRKRDKIVGALETLCEWPEMSSSVLPVLLRVLQTANESQTGYEATCIKYRVLATMRDCEKGWKKDGHKDAVSALRWYLACPDAEDSQDWNLGETAESMVEGGPGYPKDMDSLVLELADRLTDCSEEEIDEELRSIKKFYKTK